MLGKIGSKSLHRASKLGNKAIHSGAKIGAKYIDPAMAVASIAMPEVGAGLAVGGAVAKPVLKALERGTR
tara:strand:+ start:177 stop:386 length:210 start_codon:yes stop_codon:yes gene_type:complete